MLIYFLRGTLPWRKLKSTTVSGTWDLIRDAKLQCESAGTLVHGLPREFKTLHEYARGLQFGDTPDYTALRRMFHDLGDRMGVVYPELELAGSDVSQEWRGFDWMVGRKGERRGRTCEACKKRAEALWTTS